MSQKFQFFLVAVFSLIAIPLSGCSDNSNSSSASISSDGYGCSVTKDGKSVSLSITTPYFTQTETAKVIGHGVEVTTSYSFPIRNPYSCIQVIEEELSSIAELISCDKNGYSYRDYDEYASDDDPPKLSRLERRAKAECVDSDEFFDKIRRKSEGKTPEEYWGITADFEEGFYDYSLSSSSSSEEYKSSSSEEIHEAPKDATYATESFKNFKPDFSKDYSCSIENFGDSLMTVVGKSKNFNFVMTYHAKKDSVYIANQYYFPTQEIAKDKCYDSQSENYGYMKIDKNDCTEDGFTFYYPDQAGSIRETEEEIKAIGKTVCVSEQIQYDTEAGIYEEIERFRDMTVLQEDFESDKFSTLERAIHNDGFALKASSQYLFSWTLDASIRFGALQFEYKPTEEEFNAKDEASIAFFGHSENEMTIYYDKGSIYFYKNVNGETNYVSAKAALLNDYNTITAQWGEGRMELYLNGELLTRQIVEHSKYEPQSSNKNLFAIGRKDTFDPEVIDPMQANGWFDNITIVNGRIIRSKETLQNLYDKYEEEID